MKSKSENIVCLSMTTWEGDYMKAVVKMMNHLSKDHKVLFVNYPSTWKDVFMMLMGRLNGDVKRLLGIRERLTKTDGVYQLVLAPILPINWIKITWLHDLLMNLQMTLAARDIRHNMRILNMENPVYVNAFNPVHGYFLVNKLREKKLIYYCYDEISAAEWGSNHGGRLETKLAKKADRLIVTSKNLLKSKEQINPNTVLVENGVDFALFNQGYSRSARSMQTIGYMGSLDSRLDIGLLCYLAEQNPDKRFEFIGRIVDNKSAERLNQYGNVLLRGSKRPEDLPELIKSWRVGLIPFLRNEFTRNIYPLKINEYLAAGISVVSTPFGELTDFADNIRIAADYQTFNQMINEELNLDRPDAESRRIQFAQQNDWSIRAQKFQSLIS